MNPEENTIEEAISPSILAMYSTDAVASTDGSKKGRIVEYTLSIKERADIVVKGRTKWTCDEAYSYNIDSECIGEVHT